MTDQSTPQGLEDQDTSIPSSESPSIPAAQGPRSTSRGRAQSNQPSRRSSSNRQYLFIDASADRSTSSEAVRVYVMRESHRNRRERQNTRGQSSSRASTIQNDMVIFDRRTPSRPVSTTPPDVPTAEERYQVASVPPLSLPRPQLDWVSIARTGVSPAVLNSLQELSQLAEGYLRTTSPLQPDLFDLCKGDALSTSAYLAWATAQLASGESESSNLASVQFENRALELLRARITQSSDMHMDTTIVAVLLLVKIEEQKQNAESADFHRKALQRLVEDRGGLQVLAEQNAELGGVLLEGGFLDSA